MKTQREPEADPPLLTAEQQGEEWNAAFGLYDADVPSILGTNQNERSAMKKSAKTTINYPGVVKRPNISYSNAIKFDGIRIQVGLNCFIWPLPVPTSGMTQTP